MSGSGNPEVQKSRPRAPDVCGAIDYNKLLAAGFGLSSDTLPPYFIKNFEDIRMRGLNAKSPAFEKKESRMATFANWPLSSPVRPEQLANAGFFSTGSGQQVACFNCGGSIMDWEADDVPWVKHTILFATCPFAVMLKNQNSGSTDNTMIGVPGSSGERSEPSRPRKNMISEEARVVLQGIKECLICGTGERCAVLIPCAHFATCLQCGNALPKCPICKQPSEAFVLAFTN